MKKILVSGAILLLIAAVVLFMFHPYFNTTAEQDYPYEGDEPDMPAFTKNKGNKEEFMLRRAEGVGLKRGIDKNKPLPDRKSRQRAIAEMERQEEDLANMPESDQKESLTAAWTPIGPAPIPNGQTSGVSTPVSGRVTAIAVHPTNPNIVYVGTAQGGLYRTTDGGVNWTPILDNAMSLSIGAVTIDTGQPETVYVGTGEGNFGIDSFFGVGVYRIDNASSASPVITGPLNKDERPPNGDVFSGRAITKIAVYEFLSGQIYVATARGIGGIGANAPAGTLPNRGIYRSDNITLPNPTFKQVGVFPNNGPFAVDMDVRDIVLDPTNADLMIASVNAGGGVGGLYWSNLHRSLLNNIPWFQSLQFNGADVGQNNSELAIHHTVASQPPTIYAATGVNGGTVLRSTNHDMFNPNAPPPSWTQVINNNFCSPQCFYDIAVAVDPTNASRVYLGGAPNSMNFPGALTFGVSTNGATSFTRRENGLHSDTHVIAVAPSQPSIIYLGTDGGISKSTDSGATWTSLNNSQFNATQFMSIALHPTDPNFTIGGTQDNGTNFYKPDGTWTRADFGDGGYAVIDQNATDTTSVRMYHTYFNQIVRNGAGVVTSALAGYGTVPGTAQARDAGWTFRGCDFSANPIGNNGISCSDTAVNFYAPLARGPGNPNPIYYATDRLYRSTDNGVNHTVVSQAPITANVPVSAIGISPQNDNVRIVGQNDGGIWGTITGSSVLTNLDPADTVPNNYVARAVIDPNNQNTAYVTLSAFGVTNVWKTTNLQNGVPTWTAAAGSGANALPRVPVNAFLVDPANSNTLYAGTDIGVFISMNGGASWTPFGTGLPRVAVFDMAITANRKLRIATHGRGMWDLALTETPSISINDVSQNEGNSGTTAFNFNVTLSSAGNQPVTVNFATADNTATIANNDYVSTSGTLTFNPGETSKTITVQVNGNTTIEPNETFYVNLSNASNATIADNQGIGTIVNDDSGISVNDISMNEGNSGTTAFTFTVNLTPANSQAVTVNYSTGNGTAAAPGDYVSVPSTLLVFGAGELSKQVTVLVNGDTTVEPNETFTVNLSNPSNASIADNQGVGTIINDDGAQPGVSVNDVSMNEGNGGTTVFNFTVSLSAASSQTVTVNYATADGTAFAPSDYTSVSTAAVTFNPGETTKQISVSVNGDTAIEPNETFNVNLSNAVNAAISDNQGVGTIVNDDGCNYSINPTSQSFPVSGGSGAVQVTTQSGCAWTAVSNNSFAEFLLTARNQSIKDKNGDFIASLTTKIDELFSPNSINAVFGNSAPITIPDSGTASPYPSNITVSGMTGAITDLNVKIINFSHTFPDDAAFLLVSPDNSKKFILQSDSGGGTDVVNLTYTFDDQAAGRISDDGPMPANNSSVRPSSIGDDDGMPSPAPDLPYSQPASAGTATLNGTFGGINPNGTWKLFVIDFFQGDDGSIGGGWSLDITTQGGTSSFINVTSGQNGNGSGTVSYSVGQNTTGQSRTGTITIAGQTFTVNQSNTETRRAFDFDGDGKADIGVFRPSGGAWYLLNSSSGFAGLQFGASTDRIVPADYDGDGKTDIAVFRAGAWYLQRSQLGFTGVAFGIGEDIPVPADYDGDGKSDIAVFRPSSGAWYLLQSTAGFAGIGFGQNGDKPVAADYDGDGKADIAVFRAGIWYLLRSQLGFTGVQFGDGTDKPVAADYDGDGKADIGVYRPSGGAWYLLQSAAGFAGVGFGISTDLPAPADFDGDGKADIAVFRDGNWYLLQSQRGFAAVQFGAANDKPASGAFVP